MTTELLSAALACIRAGISIIPIDHRTKQPAMHLLPRVWDEVEKKDKPTWKPFQSAIADEATVRRWFGRGGAQSMAVVCGAVSGGLLVLDVDVPRFMDPWVASVGESGDGLPVQQTGGGGYQVLLRCPDPGGNEKLAWAPEDTEDTGRTVGFETRGEGGYAVVAPSVHPTGKRYVWLSTLTAADVPTVTQEHANKLLAAARALDEAPLTRQELEVQARESHRGRQANHNGQVSVIDAFNAAHSIEAMLEQRGYAKGTHGRFIRAGGESESVSVKDGRSCHWSSDDPLNDGRGKGGCGCHDAFDVYAHFEHRGDVKAAVKAAVDLLGMKPSRGAKVSQAAAVSEPWPDPLPLPAGLPAVMPFDFSLLPDAFHGWVTDISQRMQCPPDYCAATAMIVAGALIGRRVAIRPKRHDDWQVVANLYGMNVGRPSLMKTPAMKEVLKYLCRLEVEAKQEYARAMEEHETAAVVAEVTKKVQKESLKKAVKDGGDAQAIAQAIAKGDTDEPVRRRYMVNDTTVEKLGVILAENPNGVLIFVDELVSFLRTMDREGHEADRGFYLMAWAGDSRYTYDRIGRGTLDIEAAIVSIVGSIQPGVIADYLRGAVNGGGADDGLIQRFQVTVWPDAPATWKNIDRYPDADAKGKASDSLERLAELTPGDVQAERDNYDRDAAPFLRFDPTAQDVFDRWRADLETRLRAGDLHPAIESHLAKYRSLIPSLALILHLLDGGIGPVGLAAIKKAIGWGQYLESHARRLYAGVTEAPAVAARLLAARIQAGDVSDHFAARDVYRNGWAGLDKDRTEAAIDVLLSLHWLEERIEPTPGKPRTRFAINPKIVTTQPGELTKPTKAPFVSNVSEASEDVAIFDGDGDDRGGEQ